ncbi:NAD(P)H-dependent oxidoreductase [Parendozoicomonas haliclonae]|uniref:General stress protein 14 n=1 Tax=Parendozoicomonas haliclonae TaxID=1960125 RepID=A0A1X7AEY9_9GAMM|nr:NAD(P)H-dependent oxidoreductase [Parendozoicomonas haliclonae]SMA34439.1 General stress protein 14 [Parendozoicomonas haliclonae]
MSHVVVISGHPDLEQSFTNTVILDQLASRLDSVDIRRLDTLYPDYKIDVAAEQAALIKADIIVLQYPFYWYTMPGLLKKWMDDVMTFNFAYGPEGDKLKDKELIASFTVGGPQDAYDPLGYNHFPIEQFMYPIQQTAYLAGLKYNKPVYTHQMVYIPGVYNKLEDVQARARDHGNRLLSLIHTLSNSPENRIKSFVANWFSAMDKLEEDTSSYTTALAEDLNMVMPEGTFTGHSGFRDWYAGARKVFKPDCVHTIEQIDIKNEGSGYHVELRIRLIADTFEDSHLNGQSLNLLVNEVWKLSMSDNGQITIHDYLVTPV